MNIPNDCIARLVRHCVEQTRGKGDSAIADKIAAIKMLREFTGFGLKVTKDLVEAADTTRDPVLAILDCYV